MASRKKKIGFTILLAVPAAVILSLASMSFFSKMQDNLGIRNGQLAPCPASPNAVSSMATDPLHQMDPIPLTKSPDTSMALLKQIIEEQRNAKIISSQANYLHAEFTSTFFRFVDDVEFYLDENARLIHFRSASRTGHSDFGVNRKRMQKLVKAYQQELASQSEGT